MYPPWVENICVRASPATAVGMAKGRSTSASIDPASRELVAGERPGGHETKNPVDQRRRKGR